MHCVANENGEISFTCNCDKDCRVVVDLHDGKAAKKEPKAPKKDEGPFEPVAKPGQADKPKIGPRITENLVTPEELKDVNKNY